MFERATKFAPWILFALSVAIQFSYLRILGIHMGGDSEFYTQGGAILLQSHFSFSTLLHKGYPLYYVAYPTLLALVKNNIILAVWIQIILQAFASVLIYRIASRLHSTTAGVISGLLYAVCFELFQWNTYILTDSVFLFLIVTALYLYTKKSSYIFLGILCVMALLRPTTAPFLIATMVAATWHYKKAYKITGYLTLLFIITLSVTYILSQSAGTRLGISGYIYYFASLFERGVLVRDRTSLLLHVVWGPLFSVVNIYTFIKILFLRILLFWAPSIPDFSFAHTTLNILTLIPIYILGIFGISKYGKQHILGIAVIIIFWIFQSFTELDYDWRYRIPVLPALIIFAGMGTADVVQSKKLLIRFATETQSFRFLFFGIINAGVDYIVLNTLYTLFGISLFWSVFWGFIAGGIVGYFLHSRFTFRYNTKGKNLQKLLQYLTLCIVNLALTEIVIQNLTFYIGLHYNISKLITLILIASISFFVNKFFFFRSPTSAAE